MSDRYSRLRWPIERSAEIMAPARPPEISGTHITVEVVNLFCDVVAKLVGVFEE
jgi:hypothetical protein